MSRWATSPNENNGLAEVSHKNQVSNNKFNAEIAMIEQRLLRIQKMKQDNIIQQSRDECGTSKMLTSEKVNDSHPNQSIRNDSLSTGMDSRIYKTPEANTALVS